MEWKCECGEVDKTEDELRCASCGKEISEERLAKFKGKNIYNKEIKSSDGLMKIIYIKFKDNINGLVVGVLVGLVLSFMICYDRWLVRFSYDANVFKYYVTSFGVVGAIVGNQFIKLIKFIIKWVTLPDGK